MTLAPLWKTGALIGDATMPVRTFGHGRAVRFSICAAALSLAASAGPVTGQIVSVRELTRETPDGPARLFVATIDLADPAVEIVVTGPVQADAEGAAAPEAILMPTDRWAKGAGVVLAINANYFGAGDQQKFKGASDIIGLAVSDGVVVSPPRTDSPRGEPTLFISRDGRARIEMVKGPDAPEVAFDAVAGVGAGPNEPNLGGLLVTDGVNTGATARVDPLKRHPRTAAGVSADGRTLFLVVADGRQKEWSVGMTLPELADVLIELGAADALNLDGGGSSAFIFEPRDGPRITNRPSDGRFRPVANHLGVRVREVAVPEPRP